MVELHRWPKIDRSIDRSSVSRYYILGKRRKKKRRVEFRKFFIDERNYEEECREENGESDSGIEFFYQLEDKLATSFVMQRIVIALETFVENTFYREWNTMD